MDDALDDALDANLAGIAPVRKTVADFDPRALALFDNYVHGVIDRRQFLRSAAQFAGAVGAVGLLTALSPQFAAAQQVKPDDARLSASFVEFPSPEGYGKARAYLVRPASSVAATATPAAKVEAMPTVLVVHENRGLNPHIQDIARRLALAGYIAMAPDALFPLGGYPGEEDAARALFAKLEQDKTRADFIAAAHYLASLKGGNGRMGAVGFCWGGGIVNMLATTVPALAAAAPFYGIAPPIEDVPAIKAELLIVLAAQDERVNATWPAYKVALDAAHVRYALLQPAGTQHGFNNDTTPRFDVEGAKQAWTQTLELFGRTLRGSASS